MTFKKFTMNDAGKECMSFFTTHFASLKHDEFVENGLQWCFNGGEYDIGGDKRGIKVRKKGAVEWKSMECAFNQEDSRCCVDGKLLLLACHGFIQIWNMEKEKLLQVVQTDLASITSIFTSKGKVIICSKKDFRKFDVQVLDIIPSEHQKLMNGKCFREFRFEEGLEFYHAASSTL
jgi:hypothetical protein